MKRAQAVASLFLVASMVGAGCFGAGSQPLKEFVPIPAPTWQPGYQWNYIESQQVRVDAAHGVAYGLPSSSSDATPASIRVINASTSIDGRPAYVLAVDGPGGGPLTPWEGTWAVSTDNRTPLAWGSSGNNAEAWTAAELGFWPPAVQTHGNFPNDPCAGAVLLHTDLVDRRPWLPFPLVGGHESVGPLAKAPIPMLGTERVGSPSARGTPAGSFLAVPIRWSADGQVEVPGFGNAQVHYQATAWYSQDVQNIVQFDERFSAWQAPYRDGDEPAYGSIRLRTLDSFSLRPTADGPGAVLQTAVQDRFVGSTAWTIGSDAQRPPELSGPQEGPRVGLAQALESTAINSWGRHVIDMNASIDTMRHDERTHYVAWRMTYRTDPWRSPLEEWYFTGSNPNLSMPRPGHYTVEASVLARECGSQNLLLASVDVPTTFTIQREYVTQAGTSGIVDLADFPATADAQGEIIWYRSGSAPVGSDDSRPVVLDERGNRPAQQHTGTSLADGPGGILEFVVEESAEDWTLGWEHATPSPGAQYNVTLQLTYGLYAVG